MIKINSWHNKQIEYEKKKVRLYMENIQDIDVDDLNECNIKDILETLEKDKPTK